MISAGILTYSGLPAVGDFERTEPLSFEMWVYPTSGKTNEDIISKFTYARGYRFVSHGSRGKVNSLEFGLYNDVNNWMIVIIPGPLSLPINTWQHYVVTYTGSGLASGAKIYVNGVSKALTVSSNTLTGTIRNTEKLKIGTGYYPWYAGKIDELTIYNRVLPASEVTQRYNSGAGTETLFGAAYLNYKLNELSGSVVSDSSGNSRNAITVGNPSWVAGKLNNSLQLNGSSQYILV